MNNPVSRFVTNLLLDRPVRNRSYTELAADLTRSGEAIERRLAALREGDGPRRLLSHIIGLERWAQRRLRVALGEPFVQEEYDGYRPSRETSWADLRAQFAETRRETVALAEKLESAGIAPTFTVAHNSFGPLTLRAWLRYMQMHADLEMRKLR